MSKMSVDRMIFDIEREVDLIEEVMRVIGYGQIPTTSPQIRMAMPAVSEAEVAALRFYECMIQHDYQEIISYSFVDQQLQALLDPDMAVVPLANPLSQEMGVLRTTLWTGLLPALRYNLNRQQERVRLFEVGAVFHRHRRGVVETSRIAGVVAGPALPKQWGVHRRSVDFFDLKGDVEADVINRVAREMQEMLLDIDGVSKAEIVDIAVQGTRLVKHLRDSLPDTDLRFQYSPESFTGTELDFAVEVCDAINDVWKPQSGQKVIINLPATVEMATPNVFADQVEWFCEHVQQREHITISVHTHNDRGCAVAAAELALMAGADRVEGTLLGNGERTGNTDIITMAMNMYSQGIDPKLN